ncbi:hypothetical protein ACQBAU_16555 [Propionibacteriaceae bacterium Y2011]|uniref:hypothetical protein n=1 Tax=Microlunatus sp. Y2014 TaxID=3418488 RepID=UPI003B448E53
MVALGDRVGVPAFHGLAGVGTRDITPEPGIRARNWGPADWDAATGVHRRFTLTAIALAVPEQPDEPAVMITMDGTWWRRVDDEARCREAVLTGLGLSADRVLISLSHTHAGPVLCAADAELPGGAAIPDYLDRLAHAATEAAREALADLGSAVLEWSTGRCGLAGNRELLLEDGCGGHRPVVGHNPLVAAQTDTPADDLVLVGRLTRDAGTERARPLATIVNYACHPTTMAWQSSLLSPDYVGAMRDLVERTTGAPVAFLQGASGELAPRQQYTGDTAVADRHGTGLGHAVLAALAALPEAGSDLTLTGVVESGAPLAMWEPLPRPADPLVRTLTTSRDTVELDLRSLPSLAELATEWADIDPRSRAERLQRARNLRDGYVTGPTVQHPVWVWQLGSALLVAHPGEAYSPLQLELRNHAGDRPVLVANLTNGPGFVYLPTRHAYEVNAYQAWQTPLAPGSLERLTSHACNRIDALARGVGR